MNSDSENTLLDNIEKKIQKILDNKFKKSKIPNSIAIKNIFKYI